MNSTPSKVFRVTAMQCENRSHADKIAELLRTFPHREYGTADKPSIGFSILVKADSLAHIQTAIASALGKAKAIIGESSFMSDNKLSSEPFEWMHFEPARTLR